MSNVETVVPATILNDIKTGLVAVGYAHENTPLSFVQDCYFKYVMINQVSLTKGFSPTIPYAIALLPQSIQAQLTPATPINGMWAYTQDMDDQNRIVGDFRIQVSVDPYNATIDTSEFYFTIRDVDNLSLIDPIIEFVEDGGSLYLNIKIDTGLFVDGKTYELVMNYGDTVLLDFEPHTFKSVAQLSPLDQVESFAGNLQAIDSNAYSIQEGGANSPGYVYAQLARNNFADLYVQNVRFEPRMVTGNFKTQVALNSYNKVNEYFALAITQRDKNVGVLDVTDSLAITGDNQDSNGGLVLVFVGAEGNATHDAGYVAVLENGVEIASANINTLNAQSPNNALNVIVEGVYRDTDHLTDVNIKVVDPEGSGTVYLEVTRPVDLTDADGKASCVYTMSSKLVDDVASKGVPSNMSYSIYVSEDYQWFVAHS